jgi:hypothetical protein
VLAGSSRGVAAFRLTTVLCAFPAAQTQSAQKPTAKARAGSPRRKPALAVIPSSLLAFLRTREAAVFATGNPLDKP